MLSLKKTLRENLPQPQRPSSLCLEVSLVLGHFCCHETPCDIPTRPSFSVAGALVERTENTVYSGNVSYNGIEAHNRGKKKTVMQNVMQHRCYFVLTLRFENVAYVRQS